ncbi:GNAT family protein [Wukongibacter baidiensis]|uniref:GNAT family N-acetyltransferase n=1 Tax=Wukongibacter baidiensis TaxID=1723361 RepID=UPI003D7FF027
MNREIVSERLVLKVLDETFADRVLKYNVRNKDFLGQWEPVRSEEFYTEEFHRKQLQDELIKIKEGKLFKVWIFEKSDKNFEKVLGSIALSEIIMGCFCSCFIGYKLDKDKVNKGYMTEALKRVIQYAFDELGLHRIEANIIPKNGPSLKVVEKVGFYNEGTAKKYLRINGVWEDHIHMVIRNEAME